jgi:hypothetical protein
MSHSYRVHGDPAADIAAQIATFGFTTTYEGKALGEILKEGNAEGIAIRSANEQKGGEGPPWKENSEPYRSDKFRRYGVTDTNYRTRQMLSIQSLEGTTTITKDLVTIAYGTGQAPTSGATGYIDPKADDATDVEKAGWAEEQGRGFFQLDENIKQHNFEDFSKALGEHMRNTGR